jgi:Xaa-Pro aminopeptidase
MQSRYFCWLENELAGGNSVTEAEGADQLEKLRSELSLFQGLSFDTISGSGPNGAIIHYKPDHENCSVIDKTKMYLCDSGGQYLDGTTDVTRTVHFGEPTAEEKECYTRVLKGHIQIDMLVFPSGTTGYRVDSIARMNLWKAGLDFRHGTGHGVGSFLNVHEGPHGIGFRPSQDLVPLTAGMTITNGIFILIKSRDSTKMENLEFVLKMFYS